VIIQKWNESEERRRLNWVNPQTLEENSEQHSLWWERERGRERERGFWCSCELKEEMIIYDLWEVKRERREKWNGIEMKKYE
jgi:hypothetical protein